jgi:hypothetical protein
VKRKDAILQHSEKCMPGIKHPTGRVAKNLALNEKSIQDSTNDEEAHLADEEQADQDDDTSLPTDLNIPISENGQLYFYNLDSNGRNIDDFYPLGESATSTSDPVDLVASTKT